MKQLKLISTLILSAALVACGGSSDSPSKPDLCGELGFEGCNLGSSSAQASSSSSVPQGPSNNVVPFHEDFEAANALEFFSPSYKELDTVNSDDMNNSFYYSTSGLESGRMVVGDGKFTIGNARFTIGQTLVTEGTHLNPDAPPADYKVNTTTPGDVLVNPTTTTWGELDLSKNWKMSFCVVEWEHTGNSANNQLLQIMLDNNQSASGQSIHGDSRVKELNVGNFIPGKRVEINVPGDVLVGGTVIDGVVQNKGTASSFIQLRIPSAAVLTMDDLWIGYQSDTGTEPSADDCSAGARVPGWNIPLPPVIAIAPVLAAGNGQISVDWEVADRATSYNVAYNTANSTTGATVISGIKETEMVIPELTNNTQYFVFVQGVNDGGIGEFSPGASATPMAPLAAPAVPTNLMLEPDDQKIKVTWDSIAGAETYTIAYNLINDSEIDVSLIESIPAEPLSETISSTISGVVNGNIYYVFVKAVNAAGESDFTLAESATPMEPTGGAVNTIINETFETTKEAFFTAGYKALISDPSLPMYFVEGGGSGITLDEAAGIITIANGGRFTIGQVSDPAPADTTNTDTTIAGDLDLSQPYTVIIKVLSAPETGTFQVYVDNNTTGQGNSIHGNNSRIYSAAASSIADGSEIRLEVDGEDIPFVGTANSFIQLRTDSSIGTEGIVISEIRIESQSGAATEVWTAEALALVGSADIAPSGSVSVNEETTVTLTATGGNLSSSAHQLFFAHQKIEMSDFVFTARIASVTGATTGNGNSYRFGLMVMSDINPPLDYASLAGWADAGFYVNSAGTLAGSRGNMKPDGSRSRSDISGLAVGDYIRIEVYDDGANKRVRRLTSIDGITFSQANSTTDFKATIETDSWYVGFYGAPGENEVTVEFDHISIESYISE